VGTVMIAKTSVMGGCGIRRWGWMALGISLMIANPVQFLRASEPSSRPMLPSPTRIPQIQTATASPPTVLSRDALEGHALQLANQSRQPHRLPTLVLDPLLSRAAQQHAEDMARRHYFNHTTPEGHSPTDRYIAVGGQGGAGENIVFIEGIRGSGQTLEIAKVFHRLWMQSPRHRDNLLASQYRWFGYGYAVDSKRRKVYGVQMFR
jgi:uncharacterized protein YkwD